MKLLVMDVEGTLFENGFVVPGVDITSTVWQGLALALGPGAIAEEQATHSKWTAGGYRSYVEWMKDTVRIHQEHGLQQGTFRRVIDSAKYNDGVPEFFAGIDRAYWQPVLVSGGFAELAQRAQIDYSIHHAFAACEYFFDPSGRLASFNLLPCDFEGKLDFIALMLREYNLREDDWVFIGDGANDVPIAKAAPVSLAYRPHPRLREVADECMDDYRDIAASISKLER